MSRPANPGWLADYTAYTGHDHFPAHWHLACGMALVGLACGHNVSLTHRRWQVRPLIHLMLIGDSGTGKGAVTSIMRRVQSMALPDLNVVADEATPRGILNAIKDGQPTLIVAEEMTTLLNKMDFQANIVPILTRLADNGNYDKALKGEAWHFKAVRTSILLGSNERAIRERFTATIIEEGMASRFLWLRADRQNEPLDQENEDDPAVMASFGRAVDGLRQLAGMSGKAVLSEPAASWYSDWHGQYRNEPPPDRSMSGYYERRHLHMLRHALVAAVASGRLTIEPADLDWSWDLTLSVQEQMLAVFGSLKMSAWGQAEAEILSWIGQRADWVHFTEVARQFHGRYRGTASVKTILASLEEAERLTKRKSDTGNGWQYSVRLPA